MSHARAHVGATAPWKEVAVDGVRLAYDDNGSGPVVLCLHAIGHGARDFAPLRQHVGQRYRIIALDWPGQGNSGNDHLPPSAGRYADLLAGFLTTLGLERVVLLGNSIGGAAAIRYAHDHPETVAGLILENSGGLGPIDSIARLAIGIMVRFFSAGTRHVWWYPRAFAAYYRSVLQRQPAAAQRERIIASGEEIAPLLADTWRSFAELEADLRGLVHAIRCPVLVAWGTGDRILQLKRCLPAIQRFPDVQIETFDVGHAAHLEAPEAFASKVDRFLERVTCRPARESMTAQSQSQPRFTAA